MENLHVKLLDPEAKTPTRGSSQAAGLDLYANDYAVVPKGDCRKIPTGIAVAIPEGYGGFVWPRSRLAAKFGADRLAGLIDSDYRGEIIVILQANAYDLVVRRGDRIAQLVIQPIEMPDPVVVDELPDTVRGDGGFGSTGR